MSHVFFLFLLLVFFLFFFPLLFPRNRRGGVLVRFLTGSAVRNQSFWVSPPRSPLAAARIDRSRRGEANNVPGPDQLLDLGKSMFSILRGAEIPPFSTNTLWRLGMSCFVGFWREEPHEARKDAARIDRSWRGEANAAPGPDQLLDLGKSIFSILRGGETPTQRLG